MRFTPLIERPKWLRVLVMILVFPFAAAPNSWIPWGFAIVLVGVSIEGGNTGNGLIAFLAAMALLIAGVVLYFWRPHWIQPRSLRPRP
jgi:hypothetical protein